MTPKYPTVIPMLAYEDGFAATDWLVKAFGFQERARMIGADGRLTHGEMVAGDGVMLLATPIPDYESPKHHREKCEQACKWSAVPWIIDGVLVYVNDLDAHFARAKMQGGYDSFGNRGGCVRPTVPGGRPGGAPLVLF
jgi:uncharacterized glyoxalase superfamily protein PhnB